MVEEALDVHGEEGGDQILLPGCVDVVGEGESGVKAGGIGAATELVERHEFVFADVVVDTRVERGPQYISEDSWSDRVKSSLSAFLVVPLEDGCSNCSWCSFKAASITPQVGVSSRPPSATLLSSLNPHRHWS